MKHFLFILLICNICILSIQAESSWFEHEYNGNQEPDKSQAQWKHKGYKNKASGIKDGLYRLVVSPGRGWNNWTMSGKSFAPSKASKGSTIEFRLWMQESSKNGLRLSVIGPFAQCWILFIKNDKDNNSITIRTRNKAKDPIIKLDNDFVTVRILLKNNKYASVYINDNPKPVITGWAGFGQKKQAPNFGFGGYSKTKEAGNIVIDKIRWTTRGCIVPQKSQLTESFGAYPIIKIPETSLDSKKNAKVRLHAWATRRKKAPAPEVFVTARKTDKKIIFSSTCQLKSAPKSCAKQARDCYIKSTGNVELFLNPSLKNENFYQIALNISDTLFDKHNNDLAWNGDINRKIKLLKNGWTADLSLNIDSLNAKNILPIWRMNFNYACPDTGNLLTWSPVDKKHLEPWNFGYAIVGSRKEVLAKIQAIMHEGAEKLNKIKKSVDKSCINSEFMTRIDKEQELIKAGFTGSFSYSKQIFLLLAAKTLLEKVDVFTKKIFGKQANIERQKLLKNKSWMLIPVNPLIKITNSFIPKTISKEIELSGARNEHVSFQLLVLKNTKIKASDVKLNMSFPRGIKAGDIKIWEEKTVTIENPTKDNPYTFPGEKLPDPLWPYKGQSFNCNESFKAFWVTIYLGKNLPQNLYKGEVKFGNAKQKIVIPVSVKVFNFALPNTPYLKTSFCVWDKKGIDRMHNAPRGTEKHRKIHALYNNTLLEYRITPREFPYNFDINNLEAYGKWLDERQKRGSTIVYIPFKAIDYKNLPKVSDFLKQKGLLDISYTRSGDEPSIHKLPALREKMSLWKKHAPEIKNLIACDQLYDMDDILDAYCQTTSTYDMKWAEEKRKKGKETWWYVACGGTWPYANVFTDHKAVETIALFWQTFYYKADGLLYWNTTNWRQGNPWQKTDTFMGANGDGSLFYPGPVGPLPSIRLEILRDGVDDYDYLFILTEILKKNKGKIPAKLYSKAKNLLDIKALCGDLRNYSRDSEAYLKRREAIGNMIDKLQKYSK
jgi:Glycoside hydrolase 123, catalytic domain